MRRRLRDIDRHAAAQANDPWSRARRNAILLSPAFGLLAMLFAEVVVVRDQVLLDLPAAMVGPRGGPIHLVSEVDTEGNLRYPPGILSGELRLQVRRTAHGWPFASRLGSRQGHLLVQDYVAGGGAEPFIPPADDALLPALAHAARTDARFTEPVAILQRDLSDASAPSRDARRLAWSSLFILGIWSMAFAGGSALLITLASVAANLLSATERARRRARSRQGRCATCGYDLRGLDFHARCPECGTLVE